MRQAVLEGWSERCSPILVKDVRAALRGRTFKILLGSVVFIALLVSSGFVVYAVMTQRALFGPAYFASVFGCLSLAVHGILPMAALFSIGSEREENTLELLQLSGLAARRLVLGKLSSVLLQSLLVYSAFLPFLTFAFLLPGMPFEAIFGVLVVSVAACVAQCSMGIALGAVPKTRIARIVVSVVFLVGLLNTSPLVATAFISSSGLGRGVPLIGIVSFVVVALTFAVCLLTFAVVQLAHVEENRSTPIRVASTVVLAVGTAFAASASSIDTATLYLAFAIVAISPAMFFMATERERLGRVVRASPPAWARRISLLTPWLPGGGRGAEYVLYHLVAVVLAQLVIGRFVFGQTQPFGVDFMRLGSAALVVAVYLLLPSGLATRFTARAGGVVWVRVLIFALIIGSLIAPPLVSVLFGEHTLSRWSLVVRPSSFDQTGATSDRGPMVLLVALAVAAVIVNVPRILRARREWRETLDRNAARKVLHDESQP